MKTSWISWLYNLLPVLHIKLLQKRRQIESGLPVRKLTRWLYICNANAAGSFFSYVERFHSRDKPPSWFIQTKDDFSIKIEFNSQRTGLVHQYGRRFFVLVHQYGRRFFVLVHQYGRRDVTWKHSSKDKHTENLPFLIVFKWRIWLFDWLITRKGSERRILSVCINSFNGYLEF